MLNILFRRTKLFLTIPSFFIQLSCCYFTKDPKLFTAFSLFVYFWMTGRKREREKQNKRDGAKQVRKWKVGCNTPTPVK